MYFPYFDYLVKPGYSPLSSLGVDRGGYHAIKVPVSPSLNSISPFSRLCTVIAEARVVMSAYDSSANMGTLRKASASDRL